MQPIHYAAQHGQETNVKMLVEEFDIQIDAVTNVSHFNNNCRAP